MKDIKVLIVTSNITHYSDGIRPTGLWLSELTNAYEIFDDKGYSVTIISPNGGNISLEPLSLSWPFLDETSKNWQSNHERKLLLNKTLHPESVEGIDFDVIFFTGGHAVMWDLPDNRRIQELTRNIWENGGIVSSVCHGYCGLLNTRLSNGELLVKSRHLTGYSWLEEILAGVSKKVPFNSEKEMQNRGAIYLKNYLPFTKKVVVDDRLVTGQNPQSTRATALKVVSLLQETHKKENNIN